MADSPVDPILRVPGIEQLTGLKRSTLYAMAAKGEFPRPIRLTAKAVGWPRSQVEAWVKSRREAA